VADMLAGIPTLIKDHRHPEPESWAADAISAFGFGIGVLGSPGLRLSSTPPSSSSSSS